MGDKPGLGSTRRMGKQHLGRMRVASSSRSDVEASSAPPKDHQDGTPLETEVELPTEEGEVFPRQARHSSVQGGVLVLLPPYPLNRLHPHGALIKIKS